MIKRLIIIGLISIILGYLGMFLDMNQIQSRSISLPEIMIIVGLIGGLYSGLSLIIISAEQSYKNR